MTFSVELTAQTNAFFTVHMHVFICDFQEFSALKSSTFFTVHPEPGGIRILNTKKVRFVQAVFFWQTYTFGRA